VNQLDALLAPVEHFMANLGCEAPGVVAVSGGPDSVALLRALFSLRRGSPLVLAHLNHELRGAESDGDEAFVRALHATLSAGDSAGLLLRCERINVAARAAAERTNLESTARQVRYQWLAAVALEVGASWVATGHTADDQAETVLHRLLRGTGLKGLAGIPPRRDLGGGVEVLRPLLRTRRQDVLAYLAALGQDYRQDSSNADQRFYRNRLRHDLLPHLAARYNPAIVPLLCRLADQAAEVQAGEEARAAALLTEAELPRAGAMLVFDAARLEHAPRHLIREMFRLVWAREGWPQESLDFDAWDRIAGTAGSSPTTAVDLPGGIRVRHGGRVVQVERTASA
jgi:tRNA(Ile)-lysidine synthase